MHHGTIIFLDYQNTLLDLLQYDSQGKRKGYEIRELPYRPI